MFFIKLKFFLKFKIKYLFIGDAKHVNRRDGFSVSPISNGSPTNRKKYRRKLSLLRQEPSTVGLSGKSKVIT